MNIKNLLIIFSIISFLIIIASCDLNYAKNSYSDNKTTTSIKNINDDVMEYKNLNLETSASSGYHYYTPRGSLVNTWYLPNCHGFAWQNTKFPTSIPKYGIVTPGPFITDGSYYKVPQGAEIKIGDRALYPEHSAVVESVTGGIWIMEYWPGRDTDSNGNPIIRHHVRADEKMTPDYWRISDEKYWNAPNCLRKKVAFQSYDNNQFVCADLNYDSDGPLYANREWIREWETFFLVQAGGDYVHIWSQATFSYTKGSETGRATANSGPNNDAIFRYVTWGDITFIQWAGNKKLLANDDFIADWTTISSKNSFYLFEL